VRPVSDRFLASVRGSHRAVSQALAIAAPGQNGVSPGNTTELSIISGDVRFDSKAQIRSALQLEIDGTGLFPQRSDDLLMPAGAEIYVRRGLDYGGGAIEWVGLGYFRIDSIEQDEAPDGPIRIAASDRMAVLVDARLTSPIQFPAAATHGEVIEYLVEEANGYAVDYDYDDDLDEQEIGRALLAEEDRWQFLDDLITSRGKIWYWDYRGFLVIKDPPSATDPVWEVNAGADGVLIQMSRDLSREGVYNGVVATGEAFDVETPARAVAVDENHQSPTFWYGAFGKVPRFFSSPFLTTNAQALSAATSLLRQNLGLPYSADFTNVPNPALELWDPIRITLDANRQELHIVETLVIPLSPEQAQTGTTREQTGVLIGEEVA
jgi:hypothetical protein